MPQLTWILTSVENRATSMNSSRVIYITGTSFSGSTVLGALLSLHPDSICAGELSNWTLYRESQNVACSCGLNWQECSFWKKAHELWLQENHPGWLAYKRLQLRYERIRNIPFLDLQLRFHQNEFESYATATRRIYQILQQMSQKAIIFDISKKVGRARMLNRIEGLEVGYIHLIREGRGYLTSTIKHMHRQMQRGRRGMPLIRLLIQSSLEWVLTNRMAEKAVADSQRTALRLRYEDFAANPDREIDRIAETFSLDMNAVHDGLRSNGPIHFGHMWGGNEIRLSGPVDLVLDEAWKGHISPSAERLFWALAGRTSQRYGYSREGGVAP